MKSNSTWSRSDVNLDDLFMSPDHRVFRVIGIADSPVVYLESCAADKQKVDHVIASEGFAKYAKVTRQRP